MRDATVYLREIDIIRSVRLPEKVGRAKMSMWKLDPTFPKPEPATGGRRFWPLVERWLRQQHGVDAAGMSTVTSGMENFDGWREQRKARKAGKAKRAADAGRELPRPPIGVAPNVVAAIGPGGKRLSGDSAPPVAPLSPEPDSG